jgi:diguanylate cyclase (GGDEF)-like protein
VDFVAARVDLGPRDREARFWTRYFVAFLTDTVGFVVASEKLEGRSFWPGSRRWGWTVGWPLATLMIAANAIDGEAAERVSAARSMLLNPVTDLRNRRAFDADIAGLVRGGVSFTFVFADVDGLKQINDAYGHVAGDAAIKCLGAALGRQTGVAYHWGGDEFVLLVPGNDRDSLIRTVHAVFAEVNALGVDRNWPLGASFGATFVPADETRSAEEIAENADQALYAAKQAGRNRLVLSGERPIPL